MRLAIARGDAHQLLRQGEERDDVVRIVELPEPSTIFFGEPASVDFQSAIDLRHFGKHNLVDLQMIPAIAVRIPASSRIEPVRFPPLRSNHRSPSLELSYLDESRQRGEHPRFSPTQN